MTGSTTLAATRLLPQLRARWPHVFCSPPRPLAIGIWAELHNELYPREHGALWEFSRHGRALADALAAWCAQPEYFEACSMPGAPRYGLDGKICGEVSEAQAAYARAALTQLNGVRP
ncbi:ProQ/FINO family protein [Bradyrhizobium liaoningense]|uniref:ProQ/FINO family protein n=1 Tax=Bradyrhizobium liaoningense TaxID=43992 RepID=UPI001BA7FD7F|nr:ProQ/FINO family protein [Bradyrhizobium liaoningense]MBR1170706.1 hypothetical protein [Bradyrhizobium liaoningense]